MLSAIHANLNINAPRITDVLNRNCAHPVAEKEASKPMNAISMRPANSESKTNR